MNKEPIKGWVKASERLPESPHTNKCVKITGTNYVAYYSPHHKMFINPDGDHFPADQIEWLDETPIQSGEERLFTLKEALDLAREISTDFAWENEVDKRAGFTKLKFLYDDWLENNKYFQNKIDLQKVKNEK